MLVVFGSLIALTSVLLIVLILMHAGSGGGITEMFGGTSSGLARSSSVAEKNLTRYAAGTALIWFASVIAYGLVA